MENVRLPDSKRADIPLNQLPWNVMVHRISGHWVYRSNGSGATIIPPEYWAQPPPRLLLFPLPVKTSEPNPAVPSTANSKFCRHDRRMTADDKLEALTRACERLADMAKTDPIIVLTYGLIARAAHEIDSRVTMRTYYQYISIVRHRLKRFSIVRGKEPKFLAAVK